MTETQKTHDFTQRGWGHDYTFTPITKDGRQARMIGWASGLHIGDYLILQNGDDTTRYQIDFVEYECDPPDMFHALVWFAPRG